MAEFDIAVIGAGINGAGIARDAALRGLSVVVLEQGDLCSGTSAWSSRLIHGGLRYLEYGEIPLVYESLHERRTLRRIAPHLVTPLPITIPVYAGARRGRWLVRLGMLAYDLLSLRKSLPAHAMLDRDEMLRAAPGMQSDGLQGGARYHDAQVTYAERLVLENLLAAEAAGATIRTWHEVDGLELDGRRVASIAWRDRRTGTSGASTASVVINAAGPWVDQVLARAPRATPRLVGGTKGSHIVVPEFPGLPQGAIYVEAAADGRPVFIIRWNGQVLIGTTDIRFDGDPSTATATPEEVDYLLAETARVFPAAGLTASAMHYAYAGVRPLPYRSRGPESAITRRHIIRRNSEVAGNLVSIVGGKLTTYRNLAEQAVDLAGRLLRRKLPACRTADTPLPGAHGIDEARLALAAAGLVSERGVERMLAVYGGRVRHLLRFAALDDGLAATLDNARTVLAAEIALACRQEYAQTLADIVFRRTMLGLAPDQGRPLYGAIAGLAGRELGWSETRRCRELEELTAFADSLRPRSAGAQSAPPV